MSTRYSSDDARRFLRRYTVHVRRAGRPLEMIGRPLVRNSARRAGVSIPFLETTVPVVLASFRSPEGDTVTFHGAPARGVIGVLTSFSGDRPDDGHIMVGASPLALYAMLAAPGSPIPWLLAATDRGPHTRLLTRGRAMADRLDHELPTSRAALAHAAGLAAPSTWDRPPVTSLPGGYCGPHGEELWTRQACWPEFLDVIVKCTAPSSLRIEHPSVYGGRHRFRRDVNAQWVSCHGASRVVHQYRKLGWSGWYWKTVHDVEVAASPAVYHLDMPGDWPRRRRVVYEWSGPDGARGGVRARTFFWN